MPSADDQLVRLVGTGHEAAFAAIVRRYERELQAHARRLSADGRGEDAVQQAFLNAFAALQSGGEVRHLRGWLHQILRHEVTRARVPVEAPLEATVACGETLEDTVARRASAHAALAELSALPDRQRDALLGTAVFGFPRAHVARTMGLSEGAVRQLVHRARLRLREAATAVIPFPLVKLFGAARSGIDANPEAALGAGTAASAAASGGLAIKVGALLASGALATGIAVTQTSPSHHHAGATAVHHHQLPHAGAARHVSPAAAAPTVPAFTTDRLRPGDHGAVAGELGRAHGGRGHLSGTRSGHNGPGAGREGGHGHDGPPVGRGDDGSGRSPGGAPAGGDHGDGSSSSSNSGSGSGSGSDGASSGGGRSGSGSGSGHSGRSGSSSGSGTGSSGPGDGASSSDSGAGSGHSSGGGSASSTGSGADTTSSPGSSGSASPATATGDEASGDHDAGSGGGQGNGNVVSLGSDSSQTPNSGSGSGSGKENSRGSRDLSGSSDSSSS